MCAAVSLLAALERLAQKARTDDRLTVSCLAPPQASWLWAGEVDQIPAARVKIKPWTNDSLRAWAPDCVYPLNTAGQRDQLLEATGGWPQLVETAVRAARAGKTEAKACEEAAESLSNVVDASNFLLTVGLSADPVADEMAEIVANWSDEITVDDLAALIDSDADSLLTAIARLEDLAVLRRAPGGDSYRVNPLIARLLRSE
jgi:hypothetical protein